MGTSSHAWVSAGYYFTARIPRPRWHPALDVDILPEQILTLSPCLAEVIPNGWPSIAQPGFARPTKPFELSDDLIDQIERFIETVNTKQPELWPWVPLTLAEARAFGRAFLGSFPDVVLIGAALPPQELEEFLESGASGCSGQVSAARRGLPADPDGLACGYEVMGDGASEQHSLICTGSERDLHKHEGVVFNKDGLIDDLATALRVAKWASKDDNPTECCSYFVFRLTQYEW